MKKTTALLLSAALACTSLLGTAIPAFAEDGDRLLFVLSALDPIVSRSSRVGLRVPAASGFVLSPLEREKERKGGQNAKSHGTASRIMRFSAEFSFLPKGKRVPLCSAEPSRSSFPCGRAVRAPAATHRRWNAEVARNAETTTRLRIDRWVFGREDKAR